MFSLFGLVSLVCLVGAVLGIVAFRKALELEKQLVRLRLEVSLMHKPAAMTQAQAKVTQEPWKASEPVATEPTEEPPMQADEPDPLAEPTPEPDETPAIEQAPTPVEISPPVETPIPAEAPTAQPVLTTDSVDPSPNAQTSPETTTPPTSTPKAKERGFVDELGARWSVWVGGLALALGTIFLLRYSIEAGFFTPALRISLAVLLGLVALTAGEWLGRSDPADRADTLQNAYIPGMLAAVGIIALFGSVFASYALYDFVGPTTAFFLMGLLSIGSLALGLRQGPALSGLGLAGSLVTPFLVATSAPSYGGLYTYLLIVATSALVLARYRGWAWLACASAMGGLAWAAFGFSLHGNTEFWPWTLYVAGLAGLTLALNATQRLPFAPKEPSDLQGTFLPLLTYVVAGLMLIAMLYEDVFSLRAFYVCLAGVAVGLALAWRWSRIAQLALWSGAFAAASILARGGDVVGGSWDWSLGGIFIPSPLEGEWARVFIVTCAVSASLIGTAVLSARKHIASPDNVAMYWALTGSIFPLFIFVSLWLMGAKAVTHLPFALAGIGLAAALAGAVELLFRARAPVRPDAAAGVIITAVPINVFAAAACASLVFAFLSGLSGLALTMALTASLPAVANIAKRRPLRILRMACPAFGAILALHVVYSLTGLPNAVGSTIIFNELWLYLALPALAAGASSWLLTRVTDDTWSQAMEALALSFAALFAVFQVRHYMNGGDLFAPALTLEELSLQVLVSLSFSLGLSRIKGTGPRSLFSIAAMAAMSVSLASLVFGNLLAMNPFLDAMTHVRGGYVFNSLFLAYFLPGLFLGFIAWLQQDKRPDWYLNALSGVSLALLAAYVTAMVRLGFHGGENMALGLVSIESTEQYTYSIVWLLFSFAVAAVGSLCQGRKLHSLISTAGDVAITVSLASLMIGNLMAMNPLFNGTINVHGGFVFNNLLLAYLVPGLILGFAVWSQQDNRPERYLNALGGVSLALFAAYVTTMVRLGFHGGENMALGLAPIESTEQYTYSIVWLLLSIAVVAGGALCQGRKLHRLVSSAGVVAIAVSLASLVIGNLMAMNPFFNASITVHGGFVFNNLLLAYLVPGLILGILAWMRRDLQPDWHAKVLGGASLTFMVAYVTVMVRFGFNGGESMALALAPVQNTEQYTYSIVWLLFGIALLMGGMMFKVRELRIASAAVTMLTVAKVFLIDMSALEGVLRALSFVGLGAVLIGMGLVYQRVLAGDEKPAEEAEAK